MNLLSRKTSFEHDSNRYVGIGRFRNMKWRDVDLKSLQWMVINLDMESAVYKHAVAETERRSPGDNYYDNKHRDRK